MAKEYQIFRNSINNFVNEQKLDIGAKYYILKDILHDVEAEFFAQVNKEAIEEAEGVNQNAENV